VASPTPTIWTLFLERLAKSDRPIPETAHLQLASHPSVSLRIKWASREDIPTSHLLSCAATETHHTVLDQLILSKHRTPEQLSLLSQSPNITVAVRASLCPRCPDQSAAAAINRLSNSHRPGLKKEIEAGLHSFNQKPLRTLKNRPLTLQALIPFLPPNPIVLDIVWELCCLPPPVAGSESVLTPAGSGPPQPAQINQELLACKLKSFCSDAENTARVLRALASRHPLPKAGPLLAVAAFHAKRTTNQELKTELNFWLSPNSVVGLDSPPYQVLKSAAQNSTGVVLHQLVCRLLDEPPPALPRPVGTAIRARTSTPSGPNGKPRPPTPFTAVAGVLLANPALDDKDLIAVLPYCTPTDIQDWLKTRGTIPLTLATAAATVIENYNQRPLTTSPPAILGLALAIRPVADLHAFTATLTPGSTRILAASKRVELAVLLDAPDAETLLLNYHDPAELHSYLESALLPTEQETFASLAQQFAGTLNDLILAVKACTTTSPPPTINRVLVDASPALVDRACEPVEPLTFESAGSRRTSK